MKTRADTKISLRRSSRTSQISKSSASILQKPDTSTKSSDSDVDCKKEKRTDPKLFSIPESGDSSVQPDIKISPSLGLKRNDVTKEDIVTPKTKGRFDDLDDRTPLKDEILFCSQQFDSQSGVGWWDGYGSNSGRYVRLNGGRHKNTDVSDIVMQLVVPEDERHNKEDSIGTPPMLGIWMDSGARFKSEMDQPFNNTRANRRKAKAKILNDSGSMMKMMEKLRLAMEKCNDTETAQISEEMSVKNPSEVNSKECQFKFKEMNLSKDLFESSESVLTGDKKETFSLKKWSDLQKSFNKSFQKLQQNDSDMSWSDDDLFKEDSFILKATQNPSSLVDRTQSSKRKSETDNTDEPAAKNFKLNSSNKVSDPGTVTASCTGSSKRQVGKMTEVKQRKERKILSPFRRHNSFDDSFNNSLSSDCKQISEYTDRLSGKSKLRKINSFSGPVSTSTPAKPLPSVPENRMMKIMSPVKEVNSEKPINNKQKLNQRNYSNSDTNSCKLQANLPRNNIAQSQMNIQKSNITQSGISANIPASNVAQSQTNLQRNNVAQFRANLQRNNVAQSRTNEPENNVAQSQISMQRNNAKQSLSYKASKEQQVHINQKTVAAPSNGTEKISSLTSKIKSVESPSSRILTAQKTINRNNVSSDDKNNINARRRSGGIFDTSLSDDLLCQLAEPDDILESQVSQVDKMKTSTSAPDHHAADTKFVKSRVINRNVEVNSDLCSIQSTKMSSQEKTTVSSSQVGKYKFKHKSMVSSKSGFTDNEPPLCSTVNVSGNKCGSKNHEDIVMESKSLKHFPVYDKAGKTSYGNSEDLFLSDEDDGLSEPQIIAMLETAEFEATQSLNKDKVKEKELTSEEHVLSSNIESSPMKCTPEMGTGSYKTYDDNEINLSQSPLKCTPEEIEKKKLIAMQKRRKASGTPVADNVIHSSVSTNNKSPRGQSVSPAKYIPSEIEKKRQEALQRRRQKSGTITGSSSTASSPSDISPFKCSPEEIERKKLAALAKRKVLVGTGSNSCQSGTGNSDLNTLCNNNNTNVDKNIQEEIERKKQAALKRRQEKLKAIQESSNSCQNRMNYNKTNG